jgi:hypothetical protein
MPSNKSVRNSTLVLALILVLSSSIGFARQNQAAGAASGQDKTVTLAYQFPEGKTLTYHTSSNETQNMDINGQAISTKNLTSADFSLKPKSQKEGNFTLGVTMDSFKLNIESPTGNLAPDPVSINGKSFDMIVSRLGKEIDTSGAAAIQYDLGQAGKRSIASGFQAFFANLPDHPVKLGDTWPSEDTVIDKSEGGEIRIVIKNVSTLDGFETVDGFDCARIKTTGKGTMGGSMDQGGATMVFDAAIQGTQTWYFAIKEGVYVKSDDKSTVAGTIAISAANMTIQLSGESTGETRLLKK